MRSYLNRWYQCFEGHSELLLRLAIDVAFEHFSEVVVEVGC